MSFTAIGFCNEKSSSMATNSSSLKPRPLDEDEFLEIYDGIYEELVASGKFWMCETIIVSILCISFLRKIKVSTLLTDDEVTGCAKRGMIW